MLVLLAVWDGYLIQFREKGPGRSKPVPRSPHVKHELAISPTRFIRLEIDDKNRRCAIFFEADLQNDGANAMLEISAESHLVADGVVADGEDLPAGFETRVIGMSFDGVDEVTLGPTIKVGTESGTISISVLSPPEAAIGVRLRFLNEGRA
ncbi:hypothetical protein ACFS4T_08665 [Pseudomonas lini]